MEENIKTNYIKGTIIGLLAVIIISLFFWGFLTQSPKEVLTPTDSITTNKPVNTYKAPIINIKHQYKNGVHNYGGIIDLPTPCYSLSSNISIVTPGPKPAGVIPTKPVVTINLVSKDSGEVCTQNITPTYFKVSIVGPNSVELIGTLNNMEIKFNIFEIPTNEDFDAADIYIKG